MESVFFLVLVFTYDDNFFLNIIFIPYCYNVQIIICLLIKNNNFLVKGKL